MTPDRTIGWFNDFRYKKLLHNTRNENVGGCWLERGHKCLILQAQQFGMQQGVGQYKEQDVGQCRVQRHAGFRTMPGVRISDARVLRQHQGQEWGTMPGMGRKQINVTHRRRHHCVMPTYIYFCYVCCIPVHHKGKSVCF